MTIVLAQNATTDIESLTLGDEHLFEEVLLRNKDITKHLLEKFTGICEIADIEYISTEDVQSITKEAKGVRFDVYIKDQAGVAYIVELQRTDTKEIPQRSRYYQTTSDSRQLPRGAKYRDLKDNYVIFICREDIFGHGLYKYTFENMCHEVQGLKLDDGTYKIFLNTQGNNGDTCDDVVDFLKSIEGIASNNPFIKKIEKAAEEIKADQRWRAKRMQSLVRDQDNIDRGYELGHEKGVEVGIEQGIEQGLEQGIEQGQAVKAIEIAKNLLSKGMPIEDVSNITGLSSEIITATIAII